MVFYIQKLILIYITIFFSTFSFCFNNVDIGQNFLYTPNEIKVKNYC